MSVKIRPYRNGGWEVDIRVVTPDGTRQLRERKRAPVSSRSVAMRWAEGRERTLFQRLDGSGAAQTTKGGPDTTSVRASLPGRPRAGQPAEAKRDRGEGDDPARAPDAGAGSQEARRDQERGRAAPQTQSGGEVAEDGQQRAGRAERAAEEGGRVGSHRANAVLGEAPAGAERFDRVPRLRRVRTARRSGARPRPAHPSHRAVRR